MHILSVGMIWPFLTHCNIILILIFDWSSNKKNDQLSQHTLPLYNAKLKGHVCHGTPNFLAIGVYSMLNEVFLSFLEYIASQLGITSQAFMCHLKITSVLIIKLCGQEIVWAKILINSWRNTSQGQWHKGSATSGKGSELESCHATEITCS